MFRCAIVDESHMLKNKSAKRTLTPLPILQAADRCVLLSGTPASARRSELWPQLTILSAEKEGWWTDEEDFIQKYVKN
jgi:SNF2 family DNA or RNA helicase